MDGQHHTRREFLAAAGAVGLAAFAAPLSRGAAAASAYAAVVLAKKPAAYWRLGEAAGRDAADHTGNGHRGTYHGMPALRQRGAIRGDTNPAVMLDGNRSYVEIP